MHLKSGSTFKPNKIGKSEINYRKIIENWHHDPFALKSKVFTLNVFDFWAAIRPFKRELLVRLENISINNKKKLKFLISKLSRYSSIVIII